MKLKLILITLSFIFLSGCHVQGKSIPAPKIIPGEGAIQGIVVNTTGKPVKGVAVHLAEVHRSDGAITYLIDSGNNPSALTNKRGNFAIEKIQAGEYVVWTGDLMTGHQLVLDGDGNPKILVVQGDTTQELEQIQIQ